MTPNFFNFWQARPASKPREAMSGPGALNAICWSLHLRILNLEVHDCKLTLALSLSALFCASYVRRRSVRLNVRLLLGDLLLLLLLHLFFLLLLLLLLDVRPAFVRRAARARRRWLLGRRRWRLQRVLLQGCQKESLVFKRKYTPH